MRIGSTTTTRRRLLIGGSLLCMAQSAPKAPGAPAIVRPPNDRYSIFDFPGGAQERAKETSVADYTAVIGAAAASGALVHFPAGTYPLRMQTSRHRCVSLVSDAPVDFECSVNAVFIAGRELSQVTGSLLAFQNSVGPELSFRSRFRFRGGFFDGSELKEAPNYGITMLDVFQYASPILENIRGFGGGRGPEGAQLAGGGADTLITLHNCVGERVSNIAGSRFSDTLLYLSGDKNGDEVDGVGEGAVVTGLFAKQCGNAVVIKRDHVGQIIDNFHIYECVNGVIGSTATEAGTDQGKRTQVSNGRLHRIQGRPILLFGKDVIVSDLVIEDYGRWISDHSIPTGAARGNSISGIDLRGVTDGHVHDNTVRLNAWAQTGGNERAGIGLRMGPQRRKTAYCVIRGNCLVNLDNPFLIDEGCEPNAIGENLVIGNQRSASDKENSDPR